MCAAAALLIRASQLAAALFNAAAAADAAADAINYYVDACFPGSMGTVSLFMIFAIIIVAEYTAAPS